MAAPKREEVDAVRSFSPLQVTTQTWTRDSHDLFDFEASTLHRKEFSVQNRVTFFRKDTDVYKTEPQEPQLPHSDPLLQVAQKDEMHWVDRPTNSSSSSNKRLWLVVKDSETKGRALAENDIMKLGRFKFRVRQMVGATGEATQPELKLEERDGTCPPCRTDDPEDMEISKTAPCRICLMEGSGDEGDYDPLIRPCKCKGSIAYVHLGCLRHWIKGRLNFSDGQNGTYFYRSLACELCKHTYPTYVHTGSTKETLVEVPKTQPPFIVLENMVRDSQQHNSRGLHVVSLAGKKDLKLGRGHESDIRIADVSISRHHATIRYTGHSFVLEDNNSKFGTLVALRKPVPVPQRGMSVQVGRTVLKLSAAGGLPQALDQQLPAEISQADMMEDN